MESNRPRRRRPGRGTADTRSAPRPIELQIRSLFGRCPTMTTSRQLDAAARRLAAILQQRRLRIVFAESCTAGLISATLAKIPGIAEFHCGSAVVYRVETKHEWLGIAADILEKPGPVSQLVAALMAERVLINTPEADVAASITGHLGPDAPRDQDGLTYVGLARRGENGQPPVVTVQRHLLSAGSASLSPAEAARLRVERQREAVRFVLDHAGKHING